MPLRGRRGVVAILAGSLYGPRMAPAAVLIIALLVTSRVPTSGDGLGRLPSPAGSGPASGQAPYTIGGKAECPPDWPVLAMSNHLSYPDGHPAKPPAAATAVALTAQSSLVTASRAAQMMPR
jgi:hypothetical protein